MMTCSTPKKRVQTKASGFFNSSGVAILCAAYTMDITMDPIAIGMELDAAGIIIIKYS